jgi:heptosyltransferase III
MRHRASESQVEFMMPGSSALRDAASSLPKDEVSSHPVCAVQHGGIVVFRIGSIGDTVVALPCFHAIARAFPHDRKILLTNAVAGPRAAAVESVLEGTGLIDATMHFPLAGGKLRHSLALVRELRQLNPGALIYLAPRPSGWPVYRDLLFFAAAGIRRIIGAPWEPGDRQCRVDPRTGELEYEAQRLARVLGAEIPVDLSPPNWDLHLSAAERAAAERHLASLPSGQTIVALTAGARQPVKDWGEAHWATLIGLLNLRLTRLALVLVGAADERGRAERLAALWPGPKVNLCGELTPRESAAVLARCDLMVCHDSGPMHLAASQGTPCIALFGSVNRPHQWYPFGEQHVVIHESLGVTQIGVERVAEAVVAAVDRLRAGKLRVPGQPVAAVRA